MLRHARDTGVPTPRITVAIATANRPSDLAACLASLAAVTYPEWEIVLVDQSDGDETLNLAQHWSSVQAALVYVRTRRKNLSAARNIAMSHARGDIVAFIDDDCTVAADWLAGLSQTFQDTPDAQLVFGTVNAAAHDSSSTFITNVRIDDARLLRGPLDAVRVRGMGANMSVRRRPIGNLSFDEQLGAGARFRSGEDYDYAYRLLAGGAAVLLTPTVCVTHHGTRPYAGGAARSILQNYLYGAGACHAKLIRLRQWAIIAAIAQLLVENAALVRPLNALRGRPTHAGRLATYARGFHAGWRAPVERASGRFAASA